VSSSIEFVLRFFLRAGRFNPEGEKAFLGIDFGLGGPRAFFAGDGCMRRVFFGALGDV